MAAGLSCLTALSALTGLTMYSLDQCIGYDYMRVFAALTALTGISSVALQHLEMEQVGAAMPLAACKQLTRLSFEAVLTGYERGNTSFILDNTVSNAPTLWRRSAPDGKPCSSIHPHGCCRCPCHRRLMASHPMCGSRSRLWCCVLQQKNGTNLRPCQTCLKQQQAPARTCSSGNWRWSSAS